MNAAFLPLVAVLGLLALAALAWPARRVASDGTSTLIETTTRRPPVVARRIGGGALLALAIGAGVWIARAPASTETAGDAATTAARAAAIAEVKARIADLEARVASEPDDGLSWEKLGLSHAALGHPKEALVAMRRAQALRPDDASVLAETALAIVVAEPAAAGAEPTQLVAQALRLEPANRKALALAGTLALQRKDYATAVAHWEMLARLEPADSAIGRQVQAGLAEAHKRMNVVGAGTTKTALAGSASKTVALQLPGAAATAAKPDRIAGTVSLAVPLRSRVEPDDTLFVYAKVEGAQGPPLALLRRHVRDLPFAFTLDDGLAVDRDARLSGVTRVTVVARVSKSGQAVEHAGDLEGRLASVAVGSSDLRLEIDSTVPPRR